MRRPPKRTKILPPGSRSGTAPPAKLDLRTKLLIVALILGPGFLFFGVHQLRLYRKAQVEETRFRAAYHLTDEQFNQTRVLVKEHDRRYRSLRDQAEASRQKLEQRLEQAKDITPEIRQLFDQAQADREACWTDEIEHHRKMSQVMNPQDGQYYMNGEEARYQSRQQDHNGLTVLPR